MVSQNNPRNVLMLGQALQRNFLPSLANVLKERYGCSVYMTCGGPVQEKFYKGFGTLFDGVKCWPTDVHRPKGGLDEAEVVARARQTEAALDMTIAEISTTDRQLGRGYALAGPGHPRSRLSEHTSYIEMLDLYSRQIEFWDRLMVDLDIDLVVNSNQMVAAVARSRDIPLRWLMRARFGNYYYWAFDDRPLSPAIEEHFKTLPDDVSVPQEQDQAYSFQRGRKLFENRYSSFSRFCRSCIHTIALHAYWRILGSEKAKTYYLGDELKYFFRAWRSSRWLLSGKFAKLADLKGKPYVYFPLQQEPEASTQGYSREYFFQHATIAQISRDLPAGVPLVVKETLFAVGRRPREFYRQISDLKNVIFMDVNEPGLEVVRNAAVTVSIAGSAGHEAAVLGRPVITYCRYNQFNFLPHVRVIHDPTELKGHLHQFLSGDYDQQRALIDGRRLLRAVADVSFDMRDFDYILADTPAEDVAELACDHLVDSLAFHRPAKKTTDKSGSGNRDTREHSGPEIAATNRQSA